MLENCIAYENKRKFLSLEILGTIGQQSPGQGYNMLALKAAVEKEEEIMMGPKIGGVKHILKIATAMWAAIKQVNAAAVGRIPNGVAEEQMRFIGLVLAHLVFRDDPIVDPETGDYVFIARMEPSIDPIDPHVSGQIQKELDTQLRAQLACQELLVEEKDVGNVLAEKELFEILKNKVSRGISNRAEWAKWLELVEKFRLISLNHYKVPHFNLIFRTFIAFGDEAPKLILLVRVLLEGTIDEHQFDKYLETEDKTNIAKLQRKFVDKNSTGKKKKDKPKAKEAEQANKIDVNTEFSFPTTKHSDVM
uniref:RYDR_ITPR domain-containing protein n=1 Tax=Globodera pallida TaxID=36090 RepID=A0A183BQ37_GLOPA